MSSVEKILSMRTIAVVGLSRDASKPAHYVPRYMKSAGYKIIPVNPTANEILGEKCYKSLAEVPEPIEVVNVFRPANEALEIVKQAALKGAKAVWLQEGIKSEEAAREARARGMLFVQDKCMMKEHAAREKKVSRIF